MFRENTHTHVLIQRFVGRKNGFLVSQKNEKGKMENSVLKTVSNHNVRYVSSEALVRLNVQSLASTNRVCVATC